MRRRALLGVLGGLASLAGFGGRAKRGPATTWADPFGSNRPVELPLDKSVLTRNTRRDDIPAITDPAFGRIGGVLSSR